MPIFYTLPAERLVPGVSTDDGQDVLAVEDHAGARYASVYTPRPDDPAADAYNRATTELRIYAHGSRVALAVFDDTEVDLSHDPAASDRETR